MCKSSNQGNVLFLILIAVVLFAALSYAVTQSSRGGGNANKEKASIVASELVEYASTLRQAILRLKLIKHCDDTEINFDAPSHTGYTNGSAPADGSCDVFGSSGGGMSLIAPPTGTSTNDWYFAGNLILHNAGGVNSDLDTANTDLAIILFDISEDVCLAINKGIGIDGIPVDGSSYSNTTKFTGTYIIGENVNGLPGSSQPSPCIGTPATPNLCGVPTGCFQEETGGQRYVFYSALIERN